MIDDEATHPDAVPSAVSSASITPIGKISPIGKVPASAGKEYDRSGKSKQHDDHSMAMERNRRMLNSIQLTLSADRSQHQKQRANVKKSKQEIKDQLDKSPKNAHQLIEKFSAMSIDQQSTANDMRCLLLAPDVQQLGDEVWSDLGTQLVETALHEGNAHFAIDMALISIGHKSFQKSFAERISSEMASYTLCPEIAKQSLPHVVALLLTAAWPRAHSRSSDESNQILFTVISMIKDWIITITDEIEDDTEMMSRCAICIGEICRFAQRRFWMQWPELVDEIYMAISEALTSNLPLNKKCFSSG